MSRVTFRLCESRCPFLTLTMLKTCFDKRKIMTSGSTMNDVTKLVYPFHSIWPMLNIVANVLET